MIIRQRYIETIRPFLGKPMVKAITGLRRVGKSVFVRQLMDELKHTDVPDSNIIYVDMERLEFDFIRNYRILNEHVEKLSSGVSGKIYVFIDEIQDIDGWERTVASWSGQPERYDVVITGSNSTMFSGELATRLTGRYIEFPIYPLSLREFQNFYPELSSREELFQKYLRYGGMPGLRMLDTLSDETALPFLSSIHDSIILKDIVRRKKIRNTGLLEMIGNFAYDNVANQISANGICSYLKNQKINSNVQSVINYLTALEDAQLFAKPRRYDIKGKKQLDVNAKLYAADLGLRHAAIGFRAGDIYQMIENLVYVELCRRFDKVSIGSIDNYEVDFIAEKTGCPGYFQVTTSCSDRKTMDRETRPLLAIRDNYPKTIISLEPVFGDDINGIKVVSLIDFLLE